MEYYTNVKMDIYRYFHNVKCKRQVAIDYMPLYKVQNPAK